MLKTLFRSIFVAHLSLVFFLLFFLLFYGMTASYIAEKGEFLLQESLKWEVISPTSPLNAKFDPRFYLETLALLTYIALSIYVAVSALKEKRIYFLALPLLVGISAILLFFGKPVSERELKISSYYPTEDMLNSRYGKTFVQGDSYNTLKKRWELYLLEFWAPNGSSSIFEAEQAFQAEVYKNSHLIDDTKSLLGYGAILLFLWTLFFSVVSQTRQTKQSLSKSQ